MKDGTRGTQFGVVENGPATTGTGVVRVVPRLVRGVKKWDGTGVTRTYFCFKEWYLLVGYVPIGTLLDRGRHDRWSVS